MKIKKGKNMLKKVFTLGLMLACFLSISAEVTFKGKITNEKGEIIIGAYVYQKDKLNKGTITQVDGEFNLKINENVPVVVVISSIGYQKIEHEIDPSKVENNIILKNFALQPAIVLLKTIEIQGEKNRSDLTSCNYKGRPVPQCFWKSCSGYAVDAKRIIITEENIELGDSIEENEKVEEFRIEGVFVLNVYPNPVLERLSINVKTEDFLQGNYSYLLTDISGKIILKKNRLINSKNFTEKINVSSLSSGFYTVTLRSEKGKTLHKKFVKK